MQYTPPEVYTVTPTYQPKHISIFNESTQLPVMIHVDSVAAIYSESAEQHTKDGPTLLGVRFLYKHGQESFFYINQEKYAPLLAVFKPEVIGEELRLDLSDVFTKASLQNTSQSVFLSSVKSIEITAGEKGQFNTVTVRDNQKDILFKDTLIEFDNYLLGAGLYVVIINQNNDNYFEIKVSETQIEKLCSTLKRGRAKRLINGFTTTF